MSVTVNENGYVKVSPQAKAGPYTVTAYSRQNPAKSGDATITVT